MGPRPRRRRGWVPVAVAVMLALLAAGAWHLRDAIVPAPEPEPRAGQTATVAAGEPPESPVMVPIDDESIAPLASADLALLVDAGDDHALLEELELYLWLEDREADAH